MPIELTRRHNTESWPQEKLNSYLDMYDFFGFNAIESHDRFNDNYLEPLFGLKRQQWCEKVLRMCDHAHDNGQKFFLRIWGHSVMETPKFTRTLGPDSSVPKKVINLCVNDPAQRMRWEKEIRDYYVTNYAGHIDNLIGHWCDPGICPSNGCDYKTPLRLQMELHRAFKAVDPKFTSSFNLWYFEDAKMNPGKKWTHGGGWAGYNDDRDLINAKILDQDVIIATATSLPHSYKDEVVKSIIASGHKPACWTWYRADQEVRPSLHIHLHERLGDYFKELPASAKELEWHSMERNVHAAANTANYYVAGRIMWDPSLDVDALLHDFLTFSFGASNADNVMPAYLAIEKIRCHTCYNFGGINTTGMGTTDPQSDFAVAQSALSRLSKVKIDPQFRPRIPLDVSPAQMIEDLKASLEVIREYASCRAEKFPAVQKALAQGDHKAAARLINEMSSSHNAWSPTLSGHQEARLLETEIKRERKQLKSAR